MPMKEKGQATLNPGTVDQSWGYCDDLDIGQEADKKNIQNGDGDTTGLLYTDTRKKVSGNFTPLAGQANSPVESDDLIGEELEITLHGTAKKIKVIVDEASVKYKRGDVSTFTFSGYFYPNLVAGAGA